MTSWYNYVMDMFCVECGQALMNVPIFNNDENDKYASSLLFCSNAECKRHGLLTVTFKSNVATIKEEDGKGKRKTV